MSNDVKIGIKATLDDATIAASAAALGEKLNRVAQTVAQANKVKFNPISSATVEDLKKIEAKFIELTRISGGLSDRMKATGQGGSAFADLDWSRLYEDPAVRLRKMQQAFRHTTAGTAFAGAAPAGGGNAGGGGSGGGGGRSGGAAAAAAAQIAGAGMRAMGPAGGVVANAAGAGMSGGLSAGVFGLLGGLAALAVGKGVSAVKEKVDAAGQEGIGYDTLKRTLGDVNVSFNLLRESLRAASYDVGTTFEETQKLGSDFAKLSGISKVQYKTLADEVAVGGGFGRSFGVDPSQSNQFFAQMRQFGATSNTQDSRKLALMIGEAVTRSGSTTKTDELLQVIASYTANQARSGLAGANVAGYSGMLSGLVGSGVAGLDPQGAAALLSRVNGSIAGGGGAGEAGQNFLYRILGQRNGLDPVQAMMLQQQGAFGTGRQAFGAGSLYSKFSSKFGGSAGGAAGSDQTNLAAILSATQSQYKGNPSLMLNATARLLGINENQAMALHTIGPNQLGGMTGRMGRLGLDLSKLNGTGISALAGIEGGSDLGAQANALLGNKKSPLSADQANQLRSALAGGDQEKLKDILTELTYTRGQEQTEGSKTRDSIQGVEKRVQELSTGLVGPMNDMRNAMVFLAGGGKKTASQINKEMDDLNKSEKIDGIKSKYSSAIGAQRSIMDDNGLLAQERKKAESRFKMSRMTSSADMDGERKRLAGEIAAMQGREASARSKIGQLGSGMESEIGAVNSGQIGSGMMAELAKTDAELHMTPGTSAAQINKESGFNPSAYNRKSGAMGMAQVMPATLAAIEKRLGRKLNPYDPKDAVIIHREVMRENKQRFGTDARALAAYNSGWDPSKWGNAETTDYLSTIERSRGNFATGMPDGAPSASGPGGGDGKLYIEGTFNLNGPGGARAAAPVMIQKTVSAPRAQGQQ